MDERAIRKEYAKLTEETRNRQDDDEYLMKSIDESEMLHENVKRPREARFDSHFMNIHSSLLKKKAQSLNTNLNVFEPKLFVEKLLAHYQTVPNGGVFAKKKIWSEFGKESCKLLKDNPAFHYMYGSFEPGEVQLKLKEARKPKQKDDESEVKKPKIVDADSLEKDEDDTRKHSNSIYVLLQKHFKRNGNNPLCYFQFVTNPYSFSETVENMFYVSFLVKEGVVTINFDEAELPVIQPVSLESRERKKKTEETKQFVMSISVQEWEDIISEFNITLPAIPSRNCSN